MPAFGTPDSAKDPVDALVAGLKKAQAKFEDAAKKLREGLGDLATDPGKLKVKALDELLGAVQSFVIGMLDAAKALLDALLALVKSLVSGLNSLLTKKVELGPLNSLWDWVARAGGQSTGDALSAASLVALLVAFPVTIAYKLLNNNAQPFPEGKLPFKIGGQSTDNPEEPIADGASGAAGDHSKLILTVAGLATIGWGLIALFPNAMGPDTPLFLVVVNLLLGIAIFVVGHAGTSWAKINKAGWGNLVVFAGPIATTLALTVIALAEKFPPWAAIKPIAVPFLFTIAGSLSLSWAITCIASGTLTKAMPIATAVIGAFPPLMSFLKLPPWKTQPEIQATSVAIDTLGRFIPGAFTVIEAYT
ncbi:hypothetical protein ACIGXI_34395 [Kitasatospora aureofaciens]|uniref:hypothetical protein n=1 Tax=Kitasatospora aureofaciens TaxID=1894 RepID=UPI0037C621A5